MERSLQIFKMIIGNVEVTVDDDFYLIWRGKFNTELAMSALTAIVYLPCLQGGWVRKGQPTLTEDGWQDYSDIYYSTYLLRNHIQRNVVKEMQQLDRSVHIDA